MKYIISLIFLLYSIGIYGQIGALPIQKDTAFKKVDEPVTKLKIKRDFKPSAIRIGGDLLGLGRTAFSENFHQYEAQFDIDFHRYFFVVDFGNESNTFDNSEFKYSNSGNYYRVGVQANLTQYNVDRNVIFFGLRYARSTFSDQLNYNEQSAIWGSSDIEVRNDNIKARWFELNMGMKGQVFKNLYFGYTVRFKLAKKQVTPDDLIPHLIPGFGKRSKGSNLGFNYYVLYRIPFRNKEIPKKI